MVKLESNILKISLFATGLSGIVAEYVLATLATYFLGDSVLQWTLMVSVMMFAMGLGSSLSRHFENNLLHKFVTLELLLSLLVAFASMVAYTAASFLPAVGIVIYALGIAIGLLVGMEIPLVVRLNDSFESLRVNVASIIEKDYYGSLVGGLLFAFVGLPYLGLTYTPFALGIINLSVAFGLIMILRHSLGISHFRQLASLSILVFIMIFVGMYNAEQIILFGEQKRYKDKVIYAEQSRYQRIVITEWRGNHWLFINGNQQLSTLDEEAYHEPLVHPAMSLHPYPSQVLILGGGDGCALREVLKYSSVQNVTLVDLDPTMTNLGREHPVLLAQNDSAMWSSKLEIVNQDGYTFLEQTEKFFDCILIDLPDPKTIELGRLYSHEFYRLCYKRLRPDGVLVTQAGSPYYATKAFRCIDMTIASAGFATLPMHNQILTLGEWGWVLGSKSQSPDSLKKTVRELRINVPTKWMNNESLLLITSFGKNIYPGSQTDSVCINRVHEPVLHQYYLRGNWDLY